MDKYTTVLSGDTIKHFTEHGPAGAFELNSAGQSPTLLVHVAELKASNMTLEKFRQEYSEELDIIRIEPDAAIGWGMRGQGPQSYQGKALAVRYAGKDGPAELFPFPNADDPEAPVPPDVFDYLASFWVMFYPDPD